MILLIKVDFMVVVSLMTEQVVDPETRRSKTILVPKMTYQFPPPSSETPSNEEKGLLDNIPLFCFPEWSKDSFPTVDEYIQDGSFDHKTTDELQSETFSFVLTDINGGKRFGYCRRIFSDVNVEGHIAVLDRFYNR